jgi:hypothetical protein
MAAEIIRRFLKSYGGALWSASSIFEEREKDIVRNSLRESGVQYEVERFAEFSSRLLNPRNFQILERLSRSSDLDAPMTFALNVLKMSRDLLSRM